METEAEEWRVCPVSPSYMVSSLGRVKRIATGRILRPVLFGLPSYKYLGHGLRGKSWKLHQLILWTFVGPRPDGPPRYVGAHKDGNRFNNQISNLYWATDKENHDDCERHGNVAWGERNAHCRISNDTAAAIRVRVAAGERQLHLAREYGVSGAAINHIVQGRRRGFAALVSRVAPPSTYTRRATCKRGHDLNGPNGKERPGQGRRCMACNALYSRQHNARARGEMVYAADVL